MEEGLLTHDLPELTLDGESGLDLLPAGTRVFWARFRPRLYWWFILTIGGLGTGFLVVVTLGVLVRGALIAALVFFAAALTCAAVVGVLLIVLYMKQLVNYRNKEGGGRGIFLFPTGELVLRIDDKIDRTFEKDEWRGMQYQTHFSLLQLPFRCKTKREVLHFTYTVRETGKVESIDLDTFLMIDPPAVICGGVVKQAGGGGGEGREDENPFGDGGGDLL